MSDEGCERTVRAAALVLMRHGNEDSYGDGIEEPDSVEWLRIP